MESRTGALAVGFRIPRPAAGLFIILVGGAFCTGRKNPGGAGLFFGGIGGSVPGGGGGA